MKGKKRKGFSISMIGPIAIVVVVAVVVLGFGAQILGQIATSQTAGTFERNITNQGLAGLKTLGDWIPTIVLIVVLAIIIGIIYAYLSGRKNGGM